MRETETKPGFTKKNMFFFCSTSLFFSLKPSFSPYIPVFSLHTASSVDHPALSQIEKKVFSGKLGFSLESWHIKSKNLVVYL